MAALNFPDPNVTTTYTNPDTGITYEWSNNTWKAIRSAQTAPELFVDYDGDNMTGDLTFNTDKIVLGATFGTASFAGNIEIGGDVGSPTAGGVEITSTGTVIANRIGNPDPASYADCFVGRYNGIDTFEIKADGSATFGNRTATGDWSISPTTGIRYNSGSAEEIILDPNGSATFDSFVKSYRYEAGLGTSDGSTQLWTGRNGSGTATSKIFTDGSAEFGGAISIGTQNLSSDGGSGTAFTGDGRMSLQFPSGGGGGVEMFSLYSGTSKNISMLSGGSATFASSIGIGTMSPSYLLDAQYQPNRYFQLRYAKPYAKYDDNAMIDAFTFQNLGTTESGHGSKIEFIVGTSVSSNSSSIQAQREGAAGNTNLVFGTNSSEQMRINSDGWIGIGNNNPDSKLAIADANALEMRIRHDSNGTTVVRRDGAASYVLSESGISSNRELVFGSQSSPGGAITERMRIRSNGVFTWGNNPQFDVSSSNAGIAFSTAAYPYIIVGGGPDTAGRYRMEFINGNGQVGTITTQGSSTSYNESSDYRLKENIVDIEDGITRVKQLQPRRFNFITDADTTVDGFIAHEAQTVVPEAVTGTRDEVDEEGNAIMQGIDKSKLVPLLTAALQEVIAKVETLEAEIAALKAG